MTEKDQLLITSNGKSAPCSDYDIESGRCKSTGKLCDACYENSLRTTLQGN